MKWTLKHLTLSRVVRMPLRFISLLALAFSFGLHPTSASAELTQAQVQAAFEQALQNWAEVSSGDPFTLGTLPYGEDWELVYDALLHERTSVGTSAYVILSNLVGVDQRFINLFKPLFWELAYNQGSTTNALYSIYSVLGNMATDMQRSDSTLLDIFHSVGFLGSESFSNFYERATFTADNRLEVYDSMLYSMLYDMNDVLTDMRGRMQFGLSVDLDSTNVIYQASQEASDAQSLANEQDARDSASVTNAVNILAHEEPPQMQGYEVTNREVVEPQDDNSFLNPLSEDVQHSTVIKLMDPVHSVPNLGVSIDMEFDIMRWLENDFITPIDRIMKAAYLGLLSIFSALLFWRYRTKMTEAYTYRG